MPRSRSISAAASSALLAAHMIVSSPAMLPTISPKCIWSSAAATAIAMPETVFITRMFCATSIEAKPSLNTRINRFAMYSSAPGGAA